MTMPKLPPEVREYNRTPTFDSGSTPAGLLNNHNTKAGVWGEIMVLQGTVEYVIEGPQGGSFTLQPGVVGVVAPEQVHHVQPQPGSRFYVAVLRHPEETPANTD